GPCRAQFVHHLGDRRLQRGVVLEIETEAGAEAAAREVEDVLDQFGHAQTALLHHLQHALAAVVVRRHRTLQQADARGDGGQRIAQVVAEYGHELFAQFRRFLGFDQLRPAGGEAFVGAEVLGDQFGEQAEHAGDFRPVDGARRRIDGAQRTEQSAVAQVNRLGDITLDVFRRRQRVAGREPEADAIIDRTHDPTVSGQAGNGGAPHACDTAYHIQNERYRRDTRNGLDTGLEAVHVPHRTTTRITRDYCRSPMARVK